ncbi:hypothetical protein LPJ64_005521 [Coemansia asiatica]|uniref:Secreted beta-glucosidase adg3 n=1 Tax=Coemansia asiatica TaxID=1052880 RepID=A0A9W7XHJ7_9FUNG|nr:hypothetical protein LPJ64_005521 [Coemansia asiatica]
MRFVSTVAVLATVCSVMGSAAPLDLGGIGDPLAIFIQGGATQIVSTLFGSQTDKASSNTQQSSTHVQSNTKQPSTISSSSSSSSAQAPPAPQPSSVASQSSGGIPDGQGNNFKTPAGAVRFPWNYGNSDNVVPITPSDDNGGWAMSPNQKCMPNSWCPYACASGYYSAQWDPSAALYNGQGSMNGGLYADGSGKLSKPFPDRPFCVQGMMNAFIKNTLGQSVSACQTVYPGNEAMIIPTVAQAGGTAPLNVVPKTYWLGTSSQFYVNKAGSSGDQCIWGTENQPVGNWGPYIFGGGQGKDGNTYVSVQYNPLYVSKGYSTAEVFNVKIECGQGNCNFPAGGECKCEKGRCSVDNGCTVTLPQGATANFVLY